LLNKNKKEQPLKWYDRSTHFRYLNSNELDDCLDKLHKSKLSPSDKDSMHMCLANLRDLGSVGCFSELKDNFFIYCEQIGIDIERYKRSEEKRVMTSSFASTIWDGIVKLINANEADTSKRVKGIKKLVLFRLLQKELPDVDKKHIHKTVKNNIKLGALEYHQQSKSSKLIRKGQYWNTYVKVNK
jgi:hypothetical protein